MADNFTAIPNVIDDSSLDVYQFRIWHRIKRRGICFESQRSIAASTGISLAQVSRTIKWLRSNEWIVPSVDKKSGKVGYEAVIPEEQTQQNYVIPGEHVIPEVEHVIPGERHLKNITKDKNNKTRGDAELIAFFEGMTAFTSPYETTDAYAEDWLAPMQAILGQSKDFAEAEARVTYAIQHLRKIRYTIISPKSILKTALNWQPGDKVGEKSSANGNGHHVNGSASNVWDTALDHARRGDPNFADQTLKAAVRAFGWPKLQAIPPGKENFYKSDFMRIYDDKSATAST